ncbi:MAG: hypothetical protein Q8Q10_02635 [bacterium]|nr:hypothetical protein [bacterium]
MNLVIVFWAYQDDVHALIDIQERETWSDADVVMLEKGKSKGLSIYEFFQKKGLTVKEVRELLPMAGIRLDDEIKNDPRCETLDGWQSVRDQWLPLSAVGMQPLANRLGIPIVTYGTTNKYPRIPEFFFRCDPAPRQ